MQNEKQTKYDYLLDTLREGDAMVCLDARQQKVDVPQNHKFNPALNLIFNLNFKRPLDINENSIYATLSFEGIPYKCVIPFEAVWAIFRPGTDEGQVWEDSMPKDIDLVTQMLKNTKQKTPGKSAVVKSAAKPIFSDKAASRAKRDRSHLRVIK